MNPEVVFASKGDLAYGEVRRLVLSGELPAGSRVAQQELADSLRMSITPLREAIRRLSSEGLLEVDTHRNVRVARMSAAEARELFEVRLSLEPTAVELAAARRTEEDAAAMRAAAARLLPVTRRWGEDAILAHHEFHRTLYLASHNQAMIRILDDLWDKSDRYRRLGVELPPGDEPRTTDHRQHHEMLELVLAGNGPAAGQLARTHILNSLSSSVTAALEAREQGHDPAAPYGVA